MDPIRLFLAVLTLAAMAFLCLMAWHETKKALRAWSKRDDQ